MLRYFRPDRIVRSADLTWLVDESWPVAAAIDADGSMTLVAWPWPQTRVDPERDHVSVADGVGIVVRDGEQVVWVRRDECTIGRIEATLWLTAADPTTAWFVDRSYVDPGHPPAAPPPLPLGRIVAAHRDGSRIEIPAVAPVNALATRHGQVWVMIAKPPVAHPGGQGSWDFEYPTSVLRAERSTLLTDGLTAAVPGPAIDFEAEDLPHAWTWLEDDPETVLRYGVRANGLVWWAGAPAAGDYINRRALAIGHDPVTGRPVVPVDLGLGLVSEVRTIGDELWLTVQRRRPLPASADHGVDVLAVSADNIVRTVQSADSIDISHFAPPLNQPPHEEIREQIDRVRRMFDHLDGYWSSEDGATSPLSAGLTDPSVTVEGDWPQTRVIVTFRHRRRPGLLLRRTLPVFDDEGLPVDHEYAGIYLMEDLDTDQVAPAADAIDGVLDT
ncbi:hypothetical protein [Leekyejoonella antrihumi]|uniref:Uncharacterized protein n=1 Tax=Leekyejoonella antrihumi TaxID=1660198 RepID=A0A563DWR0_9MICO|nr:hypothetical protein [Leekyejoonella antrihumi]TWP34134.1 hypothetical protein FGL98_18715 [Leekyejoonella antrihumi]